MEEYKGIFYNDNTEKRYFEGGAHFSYSALVKELSILQRTSTSQKASINLPKNEFNVIYKIPSIQKEGRNYSNSNRYLSYRANSNNTNHIIKSYRDKSKNCNVVYSRNINHNNLAQIKTVNLVARFTPFKNYYHYHSQLNLENKPSSALKVLVPIVNNNNK